MNNNPPIDYDIDTANQADLRELCHTLNAKVADLEAKLEAKEIALKHLRGENKRIENPCFSPNLIFSWAKENLNEERAQQGGGSKWDGGKLRWDLLPIEALEELVKVYSGGAAKYGDRNWEKGLLYSRTYAALLRHLTAWWRREDKDSESGLSHLAHTVWNAVALLYFTLHPYYEWLDDRPAKLLRKKSSSQAGED